MLRPLPSPRPEGGLSLPEARRLALRAQGLYGADRRPRRAAEALRLLGALQLDTISVLARSHELVCAARCGPLAPGAVAAACWGTGPDGRAVAFEYWAHAASVVPVERWPWWAFRRRRMRTRERWWHETTPEVTALVRDRLAAEGPLTATDLGGAKLGGTWWDWSPVKASLERLLAYGDVVCTTRRGWNQVYDLPDRALPDAVCAGDETDDATWSRLRAAHAGRRLGVATTADLADYYRIGTTEVAGLVADAGLAPVTVEGWTAPAWADPDALAALGRRGRHRTTLLSPFDSLVWDRARTARLLGYEHRLEAYTPAPKRVHGYYTMPVLAGGRIVGRVDPGRAGSTLVAKRVGVLHPDAVESIAAALWEAAAWVGADAVDVGLVDPPELRGLLVGALDQSTGGL